MEHNKPSLSDPQKSPQSPEPLAFSHTVDAGFGATIDSSTVDNPSNSAHPIDLGQTIDAGSLPQQTLSVGRVTATARPMATSIPGVLVRSNPAQDVAVGRSTISGFSTMLPKLEGQQLVHDPQPRFEMLKTLGQGGMGEVNLVKDHEIGRTVAVKRLLGQGHDPSSIARFVDEVRTTGLLEHPNIVPIYDAGVDEQGRCFFIMKRLEGETLEEVINKLKAGDPAYLQKYSMKARLQIFVGLLNALSFAHDRGVIHRDIKPANVMIGPHGEVVLMDWGVSKPLQRKRQESLAAAAAAPFKPSDAPEDSEVLSDTEQIHTRLFTTRHGSLVGTPAYMSPEQAQGLVDEMDERSDIYSAFVLLGELLTLGHYLRDKKSINEMLLAILSEEPAWKKIGMENMKIQGWLPVEVMPLVGKGMAKKPEDRFQSVAEALEELRNAESGRGKVACPFTLTKRGVNEAWRLVEKYPFIVMPTALIMMAVPKSFLNKHPGLTAPITLFSFVFPVLLLGYLLNYGVMWLVT